MDRAQTLAGLAAGTWDLVVIGGGITGAGVALVAARRGLRVALVEQADFASGTSSRSTRLIHGGLRYLKEGQFRLVRESVVERERLTRAAPHLVRPLPFVFPVYDGDPDPLWLLRLGLWLYDRWAAGPGAPGHRLCRADDLRRLEPALRAAGLRGGGLYHDCATDDARLTLAVVRAAGAAGAATANYLRVLGFGVDGHRRIRTLRVRDELADAEFDLRAGQVLNAAGPWADAVRRLEDPAVRPLLRLTRGAHLTVSRDRLPLRQAVVLRGPDRRLMFAVPAGAFAYVGTTDTDHPAAPGDVWATGAEVDYLLRAANATFPAARLGPDDVVGTWAGLRPLVDPGDGRAPSRVSRDYALFTGTGGMVTVAGGKLTAFRAMAAAIVDRLFPATQGAGTEVAPLPGGVGPVVGADEVAALAQRTGADPALVAALAERYGSEFPQLVARLPGAGGDAGGAAAGAAAGDAAADATAVDAGAGLASARRGRRAWRLAQVRFAVAAEMAGRLVDVVVRRTGDLCFSDDHGTDDTDVLAAEMGRLLGWTPARVQDEVARVQDAVRAMQAWRGDMSPG